MVFSSIEFLFKNKSSFSALNTKLWLGQKQLLDEVTTPQSLFQDCKVDPTSQIGLETDITDRVRN